MTYLHPDMKILDWNTHDDFQAPAHRHRRNRKTIKAKS
jgi:hypothetical protein